MGETPEEIAEAFDQIEKVNRSAAKNAKAIHHMIFQSLHELSPEEQMALAIRYCEQTFAAQGLPYMLAMHAPDPDGDQRNWHFHITFSYRPVERTAEGEWSIDRFLRTDLDTPEGWKQMRFLLAEELNHTCELHGLTKRYTHLSYAASGLDYIPQEHLGPGLTAKVRRGETVARNVANHHHVATNEVRSAGRALRAALLAEVARCRTAASEKLDAVKLAAAVAASRPTINAVSVLRGITVPAAIEPLTARPDSASNDNEERSKRAAAALGADVPGTPQPSRPAAKDVRVNSPKTSFAGPLPLSLERNDTGTSADVVAYRFPPAPQPLNRLRDRPRYQGAGFSFAVPPTPLQPSTVTLDGKLVGHFAATRQPTPFTRTGSRAGATIAMRLTLSNAPPLPLSKAADTGGAHVDAVKRMRTMFAPVMPVSLQTTSRTTVSDLAGLLPMRTNPSS